jgi:hypothetical protein
VGLLQCAVTAAASNALFIYIELPGSATASALEPKHIIFVRGKQICQSMRHMNQNQHETEIKGQPSMRAASAHCFDLLAAHASVPAPAPVCYVQGGRKMTDEMK